MLHCSCLGSSSAIPFACREKKRQGRNTKVRCRYLFLNRVIIVLFGINHPSNMSILVDALAGMTAQIAEDQGDLQDIMDLTIKQYEAMCEYAWRKEGEIGRSEDNSDPDGQW